MAFTNPNNSVVYAGNGVDTVFAVPFPFVDASSINLRRFDVTDPQNPIEVVFPVWTLSGTDITVTPALGVDEEILIYRTVAPTHPTLYSDYKFPFSTINYDLDRVYQAIADINNRFNLVPQLDQFLYESGAETPPDASDLNDIVNDYAALDARLVIVETDLDTAEVNIGTLQSEMVTAQGNIANLQSDVNAAEADIIALDARLDIVEADLGALDLSGINADIAALQSDVGTLQTDVNTAEADIDALELDVADHESRIDTLETNIPATVTFQELTVNGTHAFVNGRVFIAKGGTAHTIQLPASPTAGYRCTIKKRGYTGSMTIDGNSKLVDGQATYSLIADEQSTTVVYTGTEWIII
jgi:outer membrane murein-binding lipoprotein Lpp